MKKTVIILLAAAIFLCAGCASAPAEPSQSSVPTPDQAVQATEDAATQSPTPAPADPEDYSYAMVDGVKFSLGMTYEEVMRAVQNAGLEISRKEGRLEDGGEVQDDGTVEYVINGWSMVGFTLDKEKGSVIFLCFYRDIPTPAGITGEDGIDRIREVYGMDSVEAGHAFGLTTYEFEKDGVYVVFALSDEAIVTDTWWISTRPESEL